MKLIKANIKVKCENNGTKAVFKLKAELNVDTSKSYDEFEESLYHDLCQQFSHITEYTITYTVKIPSDR